MDKKDRLKKLIDSADEGHIADQLREKIINDKNKFAAQAHAKLKEEMENYEANGMYEEYQDLNDWAHKHLENIEVHQVSAMYAMLRLTRSIRYKHHKQAEKEIYDIIDLLNERIENIEGKV